VHRLIAVLVRGNARGTPRPPTRWRGVRAGTAEPALARYYSEYRRSGHGAGAFVLRHPLASLIALVATVRLTSRTARLSAGVGGVAIHRALSRPALFTAPLGLTGVSVLTVPQDPQVYTRGPRKQTLRRRLRAAQRRGITFRPIDDPAERRALLLLADRAERSHPDPRYRIDRPDNEDLLDHDLWLAAFSAQGDPLLLAVTPTDGQWALLRYFRTLGRGPEHSDSRYLMSVALVRALAGRGIRHLVDEWHPGEIPEGLREFQRMVGFRIMRVVPRRGSPRPRSPSAPSREAVTEPSRPSPSPCVPGRRS
jgi:hypothetical protein